MSTIINPHAIQTFDSATVGQVLSKTNSDGVGFIDAPSGVSTLAELSDVTITSASDGNMLKYNASTSKWTNVPTVVCTIYEY